MKVQKIAVLGFGQRGQIYSEYAFTFKDEFQLVAVIDTCETKCSDAKAKYNTNVFSSIEAFINAKIDCDIVAVATQDSCHAQHAITLMQAGYNLLLEKPIANTLEQCERIYECSKKYNKKIIVCHVLRYTPFYRKIKEIISSGMLGKIYNVTASENVGYFHHAHSYVRGPWKNSESSSPMILAKCCHDMDILRWLLDKKCLSVASIGKLSYFTPQNAPANCAQYCSDCKEDCIYRAQTLYINNPWMANYYVVGEKSEENILSQLPKTQYDKCVFFSGNNVVDHQTTLMQFDDDITVCHTMTAFSKETYRDIKISGTKAELAGHMEKNVIEVMPFGGQTQIITPQLIKNNIGKHGGGDHGLMREVYLDLNNQKTVGITYIDVSIESHIMSFLAEQSRLQGGKMLKLKE